MGKNYTRAEVGLITVLLFIISTLFLPNFLTPLPCLCVHWPVQQLSAGQTWAPQHTFTHLLGEQATLQLATMPHLEAIQAASKFTLHPILNHQPAEAFGAL